MRVNTCTHPYDDQGESACPIKGLVCDNIIAKNVDLVGGEVNIPEAVCIEFALGKTFTDEQQQIATKIRTLVGKLNPVGTEKDPTSEEIDEVCACCKKLASSFVGPLEEAEYHHKKTD